MDNSKTAGRASLRPSTRRLIQLYSALLHNAHLKGFIDGEIYQGKAKFACVPGFNCYSCPGAVGACPLGSIQNALASTGHRAGWYVMGILLLFGLAGSAAGFLYLTIGIKASGLAGRTIAWPCHILLKGFAAVCRLESALPGSVLILGRPAWWQMLLYYTVLAGFVIRISDGMIPYVCVMATPFISDPMPAQVAQILSA